MGEPEGWNNGIHIHKRLCRSREGDTPAYLPSGEAERGSHTERVVSGWGIKDAFIDVK